MKNRTGAQFKKLNRTPKHRENLMRNMTAQLVTQERIRTTVAKAKWLQFHANALIDHALQAAKMLSQPARHMPRLFEIAPRYAGLDQKHYTRVLLDGTNGGKEDSDHAPMAILEFRYGGNSIATALAIVNAEKMERELCEVEAALYWEDGSRRMGIPPTEFERLKRRERKYQNLVHGLNKEISLAGKVQGSKDVSEYETKAREWVDDVVERGQRHLDMLPNRPIGFMHALQRKGLSVVKGKVVVREILPMVKEGSEPVAIKARRIVEGGRSKRVVEVEESVKAESLGLVDRFKGLFA